MCVCVSSSSFSYIDFFFQSTQLICEFRSFLSHSSQSSITGDRLDKLSFFFLFFSLYDIGLYPLYMCCCMLPLFLFFSHPCVRRNQWGSAKMQTGLLSPSSEYTEHIWFFHVEKALKTMLESGERKISFDISKADPLVFSLLLTAAKQQEIIKMWKNKRLSKDFFAKASEIFSWNSFPICV